MDTCLMDSCETTEPLKLPAILLRQYDPARNFAVSFVPTSIEFVVAFKEWIGLVRNVK